MKVHWRAVPACMLPHGDVAVYLGRCHQILWHSIAVCNPAKGSHIMDWVGNSQQTSCQLPPLPHGWGAGALPLSCSLPVRSEMRHHSCVADSML